MASVLCVQCRLRMDMPEGVQQAYDKIDFKPDFNIHIRPLLSDRCFLCHGTDLKSRKASLDLSDRTAAIGPLPLNKSRRAIVPGRPEKSEVVARILSADDAWKMPPAESHRMLNDDEKALIIKWIADGAGYKEHWAFIPPQNIQVPRVKYRTWIKNDIDAFTLEKLESLGWKPNGEADKQTLIRRVSLDITGLPPTTRQTEEFLRDTSEHAYEKLVDRLLASADYGEQMAVYWMDLARFADTHGYTVDRYRPAWPWRDWVIHAFNQNMPYDTFVTLQLAGDLFPYASKEQRLASAFNRLHAQNAEGGIVNEEFRAEYVMDRVNTFGTAFLGLTLECARCHDHKFDPFTQKDYYQLFSYFNNIEEAGQISWDDATPVPAMLLSNARQDSILDFIDKNIESKNNELARIKNEYAASLAQWVKEKTKDEKPDLRAGLTHHYTFDRYRKQGYLNEVKPAADTAVYAGPTRIPGIKGLAFQSNGDEVISFGNAGLYDRDHPFSIACWLYIPGDLRKGVILYKGYGEMLYNYRGYFLNLRGSHLELTMNRTWPSNSIIKSTVDTIMRNQWFHLAITYDGSSKASGLNVYINGDLSALITERDHLTKSILLAPNGLPPAQPGLRFGADFRSAGIRGGAIDELRVYDHGIPSILIEHIYLTDRSEPIRYRSAWDEYYFQYHVPAFIQKQKELTALQAIKNKHVDTIPEMMVMDEMDSLKPAYILQRGLYHSPGERVYPAPPARIFNNHDTTRQNRLKLAQWLFDPAHPLTARVLVNRLWQKYFGHGIVSTSDNFGFQGSLPSHPALLDYLARYMLEHHWDLKALQRHIVLSATYRQSSASSEEMKNKDAENKWYSRGPSKTLSAEMIRDNALGISGLLNDKIGGPSVKPYQPDSLWSLSGAKYVQDTGADLYRKSLYTFWMRTNPPPSMNIFDAPSRSYCIVKRPLTATPLQALVLMNDPQLLEASRALAFGQMSGEKNKEEIIISMYREITCTDPAPGEVALLSGLFDSEYSALKKNPEKAKGWLTAGSKKYKTKDDARLAGYSIVANTIFNSDAYRTLR